MDQEQKFFDLLDTRIGVRYDARTHRAGRAAMAFGESAGSPEDDGRNVQREDREPEGIGEMRIGLIMNFSRVLPALYTQRMFNEIKS